ncbi:signal peptidase I [Nocardioides jiangxiensis]|uniref:Signal peptidase I n=1 Tax=Nocardioides jiangxiensis TaxID=3064524 RepID=A0ABT9AZD5_9ACTN|nr:signal peptidase I [Nocardioides sp. WY-20]MDO7867951.1 signal peptidase I [Nocardioides sp. WY-20]
MEPPLRTERGSAGHVVGWTALVAFLLALLTIIAALAFSVHVKGHSMEPTVHQGDRLLVQFWKRGDPRRFDLVEAQVGVAKTPVVKRIVGLPGDTVAVTFAKGEPVVTVTPAGSDTTYVVENPRWTEQVGDRIAPCCNADGTAGTAPTEVVVPADSYWLLGDNWGGSDDSRTYGFVKKADVGGVLNLRIQPLSRFGTVPNPARLVAQN